jgi:hypothetical protein
MKKSENLFSASRNRETKVTKYRSDKILWWMQKGRYDIYMQFVNKACIL